MKIVHRIGITADETQRQILTKIGIEIPVANKFTTLELEENSKEYNSIRPYIDRWGLMDAVGTEFSDDELNKAKLLAFRDCWANGFPMPDNNQGYKKTTYDNSNYCQECGIGMKQKESFRLKKEPIWGNRHVFMLNWVYDEMFVKKKLYKEVFEKYSVENMPVLLFKKDTIIDDVVQLVIPSTTLSLDLSNYSFHECGACNRRKYELINKGFFPPFKQTPKDIHLVKSKEYFGTGANARKYLFFSKDIRNELLKYNAKINFIPQFSIST